MHNRLQHTVSKPYGMKTAHADAFLNELADDIIMQYEKKLLWHMLKQNTRNLKDCRTKEIFQMLHSIDEHPTLGIRNRLHALKSDLTEYFDENDSACVEGLVRFRLKQYLSILEQTAAYLLESYMIKQEYSEFIMLLRYFIRVKHNRPKLIHLVVERGGGYIIYNEKYYDITKQSLSEFVTPEEEAETDMDDLLISILISVAPERIVIHGVEFIQNSELFQTIRKVFDKIEYCGGCVLCKNNANK